MNPCLFVFNVIKERQSINLFCYRCYLKILILGKYIHPKFTLKCGCGAEEARVGGCVLSEQAAEAPSGAFLFAAWAAEDEGGAWAEKPRPSNFYSTPLGRNLDMLSQAFCCLQSKTCETLSVLECWLSAEMTAVERCGAVCESIDEKGLHSLMYCLPLPLWMQFQVLFRVLYFLPFCFLSSLSLPGFSSLFSFLSYCCLFELTSWQI